MYSNFISRGFKHSYFYIFNAVEGGVNVGSMLVVLSGGGFLHIHNFLYVVCKVILYIHISLY